MGNSGTGKKSTENILLENILNTTQNCIFWKDVNRRFVGVNRAFLDYYGFDSASEVLGKTDEDMGWHSNPQPFMNDELRVLQGESTYMVLGKCIAHGVERDIMASKRPLYDGDKIIGLVGSFIDVTNALEKEERIQQLNQKLEAALAREKEINQMMSKLMLRMRLKMMHSVDMITSLSKLGREIESTAQMNADLEKISMASRYLERLSEEMMDLQMIQNDEIKLEERLKSIMEEE